MAGNSPRRTLRRLTDHSLSQTSHFGPSLLQKHYDPRFPCIYYNTWYGAHLC